jgi:glycyl-tRNA synthetase beta chain
MSTRDFLVEIGTEELPPKALKKLSRAFGAGVEAGLKKQELAHQQVSLYAAPRRLAVLVNAVQEAQADKAIERRGPAVTASFGEDGCPTPAAEGFARSCGVAVEDLQTLETEQGAWLVFRTTQKGQPATALLADIVRNALDQLPIPKRMRWGDLDAEFVRPVHWVVMLFGDEVVDCEILSVIAGRETRGHRFHHPEPIYLGEPQAYAPLLETEGHVIADFQVRREAVRGQVLEAASTLGGEAMVDEDLLDEVTAMVEWPIVVSGQFDKRFLDVPAEALISTMKSNQKYFPIADKSGMLMPYFITVSNVDSKDMAKVREGNERVVTPRLADADFFWNQDRKHKLDSHLDRLNNVVFQKKLGTLYDKSERVAALAGGIAMALEGNRQHAERAAWLSKCDLMTEMVGEFPNLQGIMGCYYAQHDNEPEDVAIALDEQYLPRFAGDTLPETTTGQALAIADKLDTIVGIFGIGEHPTGNKDPFALRRAALGLLRIVIENQLSLDLKELIHKAGANFPADIWQTSKGKAAKMDTVLKQAFDFMMDRLRAYYQDTGVAPDVFDAVLAVNPTQPYDFDRRVRAVTSFQQLPEAESLAAANKRISNILKQAKVTEAPMWDAELFKEPAEEALADKMVSIGYKITPLLERLDYEAAMKTLAKLREPVDEFFDNVMVMVEDEALRNNRLCLLGQMRSMFLGIADLSRLQG